MRTTVDMIMCSLWVLTYALVLIGTIKYRRAVISPIAQLIIASFEIAVFIQLYIVEKNVCYVTIAYACWSAIEIAILLTMMRFGLVKRAYIAPYFIVLCILTAIVFYFIEYKNQMFFFSYFNTFLGEVIWFVHIKKNDYPIKPVVLGAFTAKFIADVICVLLHFGYGVWLTVALCVLLPILDLAFLVDYVKRAKDKGLINKTFIDDRLLNSLVKLKRKIKFKILLKK